MQVRALSEERTGRRRPARRESVLDLVGNTSMVRLNRVTADLAEGVEVWVKLEFMNPGGSIKDRVARQIMTDALAKGELRPGRGLLDAATGNTGVAYAVIGAALEVPVTLVMPANGSPVQRRMIDCFGATVIESSADEGIEGALRVARELADEKPDELWFANHFDNPCNARAHELKTAAEIWSQTSGAITHFVNGVGTGGTITGTSRGLRKQKPGLVVYGCRPVEERHGLEGLQHASSKIQPANFDASIPDGMMLCGTQDALDTALQLAREEGIAAGTSAGANVWCALQVAAELEQGFVVAIICDHADRYQA